MQESQKIVPIEQGVIPFYGKDIIGIRLPDGRAAVVLSSLCQNMQLDIQAQSRRIQRTEAICDDLISNVVIDTVSGPQQAQALVLHAVAYWLATIDAKRVREDIRTDVIRYQKEAVDVLYAWAQRPRSIDVAISPFPGVTIGPIEAPGAGASHAQLAAYHETMAQWHRYQADHYNQQWRNEVDNYLSDLDARMESKEAITNLIPEIIERLGKPILTMQHQRAVQAYVQRVHEFTGKHQATIYNELKTAFEKPRYQEILEEEWPQVERWFQGYLKP